MPPSCGWQRMEVMSGPAQYLNYVTGQTIYRTPPALCWRKVRAQGQEVWYNWVINTTQQDQPDEMPQYLIDEVGCTHEHLCGCSFPLVLHLLTLFFVLF